MMHWWWGDGWGMWAMWIAMMAFWLLPPLLAVALFWWILGGRGGRGDRAGEAAASDDNRRALAILKERYARGEISQEEFERIKQDILSS